MSRPQSAASGDRPSSAACKPDERKRADAEVCLTLAAAAAAAVLNEPMGIS